MLFLFLLASNFSFWANNKERSLFVYRDKIIEITRGEGITIDGESIVGAPKWFLNATINYSEGKIYGNAFNGINYLGLMIFDIDNLRFKTIDLTKLGSSTNYIQKIYDCNGFLLLNILANHYYFSKTEKKLSKFSLPNSTKSIYSNSKNLFLLNKKGKVKRIKKNKNSDVIAKLPEEVEEVYYIDNKLIFAGGSHSLIIFNKEKGKIQHVYNMGLKIRKILTVKDYYLVIINEDNLYYYDDNGLIDISPLEIQPLSYDKLSNTLLILKEDKLLKIYPEIKKITDFQIGFNDYYTEVYPNFRNNHQYFIGYWDNSGKIQKITAEKKLKISSTQKLDELFFIGIDKQLNIYRGNINSVIDFRYLNLNGYAKYFSIIWVFISVIVFANKRYVFFPILFGVPIFLVLLTSILNIFNRFVISGSQYFLYTFFAQLLFLLFCMMFEQKYRFNNDPFYFKIFSHGSAGLNNLIRLYRLSGISENGNEVKLLFNSASNLFLETTQFEIKRLLYSLKCSFSWLLILIRIDIWRSAVKKQLLTYKTKNRINNNLLRKRVKKIIEEVEKLKRKYVEKERRDISAIIKKVIDIHNKEIEDNGIVFNNVIENNLQALISEKEFFKIVDNLLSNSIYAVHAIPNKEIFLSLKRKNNEYIELIVKDNGRGIESENVERIYSPDFSTKQNGGIGLFEIKKIIEKYLGNIVYERINNYTLFRVKIRGNL